MSPKVIKKSSGSKGAKSSSGAAKASSNGSKRRTAEDVRKLVPQFVKHLTGGGKMKELKQTHGFSDDGPIRQALYLEGYDSKGNALADADRAPIKATGANLAKRLIAEREQGTPWYALAYRTGKSEAELRQIVADAGGPTGRVYRKEDKPAKAATSKASGAKKGGKKVTRKATPAADPSPQA